MKKIFFLLVLLSPVVLYSQGKTTISGTIESGTVDSANVVIYKNYVSKEVIKYKIPVKKNHFSFDFVQDRNQLVDFIYAGQTLKIYLEKNDAVELKFKSDKLVESVDFSGKAAANNLFLKKFTNQYEGDFSNSKFEEQMKTKGVDEFEMVIFSNKKKEKEFYENYPDKKSLSTDFKIYIENQIKYNYLNLLFSYPIVNANRSTAILTVTPLPSIMLEGFDKSKINNNDAIISEAYRNLLTHFVTYYASELNGFNKYKDFTLSADKKYVVARDNLKGESFLYYLSSFLLEMGEKINPETVKRIYTEMEKEDKTSVYTLLVKEKLDKWMKTKLPKNTDGKLDIASPEFTLQGLDGKELSLANFRGKVVYVDFWASWCGPCRQQFPFSKALHEKLTDKQKKNVVFLYISIDNTEDVWKSAIKQLELGGEHALSPGGWNSVVAKYYQINSIPRYLLIDKKGKVVDSNAKRPSDDSVLQDILKLVDE